MIEVLSLFQGGRETKLRISWPIGLLIQNFGSGFSKASKAPITLQVHCNNLRSQFTV